MEDFTSKGLGDSHFHVLEMMRKSMDPLKDLDSWFESGIDYLLDVGVDLEGWPLRVETAQKYPRLWLSAGYHPHNAGVTGFEPDWDSLKNHLKQEKTVALGEIGLDYYRGKESANRQKKLFEDQLSLAKDLGKPVILHNRDSDDDLCSLLKEADLPRKGVFHCFSSGLNTARRALDLGYYISFAGNLTYPSAVPLKEAAAYVPSDRLLIETDSPYLTPVPHRGQLNSPRNLPHTLRYLASLRSQPLGVLIPSLRDNFQTLFNLPKW